MKIRSSMMGLLSEAENDVPKAIEWYQKAVQIEWRAAAKREPWIMAGNELD